MSQYKTLWMKGRKVLVPPSFPFGHDQSCMKTKASACRAELPVANVYVSLLAKMKPDLLRFRLIREGTALTVVV
jgi:hypothetical protein